MADQHQPKLGRPVFQLCCQGLAEDFVIIGLADGVEAEGDLAAIGFSAGLLPESGLADEVTAELRLARSADDKDEV